MRRGYHELHGRFRQDAQRVEAVNPRGHVGRKSAAKVLIVESGKLFLQCHSPPYLESAAIPSRLVRDDPLTGEQKQLESRYGDDEGDPLT